MQTIPVKKNDFNNFNVSKKGLLHLKDGTEVTARK